jgi:hypothetical protein
VLGRFTSLDPMEQFFSGYVGIGNDWANLVDPTGMIAYPVIYSKVNSTRLNSTTVHLQTRIYINGALAALIESDEFSYESDWVPPDWEWGASGALSSSFGSGPTGGNSGGGSGGFGSGGGTGMPSYFYPVGDGLDSKTKQFKREQDEFKAFNGKQNAIKKDMEVGNAKASQSPTGGDPPTQQKKSLTYPVSTEKSTHTPETLFEELRPPLPAWIRYGMRGTMLVALVFTSQSLSDGPVPIQSQDDYNRFIMQSHRNPIFVIEDADQRTFKFITYMLKDNDGNHYIGRTSGYGTAQEVAMARFREHHKLNPNSKLIYGI